MTSFKSIAKEMLTVFFLVIILAYTPIVIPDNEPIPNPPFPPEDIMAEEVKSFVFIKY